MSNAGFELKRPAFSESGIGDLVTDSYRTIVNSLETPADLAITGNGEIRSDIIKGSSGNIWFANAFRVLPLGIGPDSHPGYPLISFYLSGKDLKGGMEVGAAAADIFQNDDFFLQVSGGTTVTYSAAAPPFHRVTAIHLPGGDVDLAGTTKCYKVVATLFLGNLIGQLGALTSGAVSVTPKLADCQTPVTDLTTRIVRYPSSAGPQEMKGWLAFVQYLSALRNATGAPRVPSVYASAQGRLVH